MAAGRAILTTWRLMTVMVAFQLCVVLDLNHGPASALVGSSPTVIAPHHHAPLEGSTSSTVIMIADDEDVAAARQRQEVRLMPKAEAFEAADTTTTTGTAGNTTNEESLLLPAVSGMKAARELTGLGALLSKAKEAFQSSDIFNRYKDRVASAWSGDTFMGGWNMGLRALKPCPSGYNQRSNNEEKCCKPASPARRVIGRLIPAVSCPGEINREADPGCTTQGGGYTFPWGHRCWRVVNMNTLTLSQGSLCSAIRDELAPNGCSIPEPTFQAIKTYTADAPDIINEKLTPVCNRHDMCFRCVDQLPPDPSWGYTGSNFEYCQAGLMDGWLRKCSEYWPGDWRRDKCFRVVNILVAGVKFWSVFGNSDPFYKAYVEEKNVGTTCPSDWTPFVNTPYFMC